LLSLIVAAAPQPILVRVAIVDNSPSMQGPRIAAVRAELTSVIRQLPPSPEFPLILVVFHERVEPTVVLTDPRAAEQAIAGLQGNGDGTHIAPALVQGRNELLPYRNTSTVLVMLYTDGEDGDQDGIHRAECQLDALFSERSRRGLGQAVFVKRWDNCNTDLIARLRAGGHVQVLDAGELTVEPLTVTPAVVVMSARRDPHDPERLQVAYIPSVTTKGRRSSAASAAFDFVCMDAGVAGDNRLRVQSDTKYLPSTLTVPVPDGGKADRLTLTFHVTPVPPSTPQSTFVLPILPESRLTVPVTVPTLAVRNRLAAEIRQARSVRWQDAEALQVRCEVDLAVTATAMEPAIDVDRATTFRIVARPGLKLAGGVAMLQMPRPGTLLVTVTVDAPLAPPDPGKPAQTGPIELAVQPTATPDYLSYDPPFVQVRQVGLAVPDQVTTTITPMVRRIGRPVWTDLVESLVAFDADVLFRVEGCIPQHTTLSLVASGNIRGNLVPPGTTLHSGETTVTLRVLARLTPGKPERLDFSIVAPSPTPAVRFQVARGFSLPATAPRAASLICVEHSRIQARVPLTVADNQYVTDVRMTPALAGICPHTRCRLPRVALRLSGASPVSGAGAVPLFQPHALRVQLPPLGATSFFLDSKQKADVELRPDVSTPAVLPGRLEITVTRQAPFKRLLTYLAWAVFPLGVLALLAKMIRRLREPVLP
jgi:hypothetical protein